MARPVKATVEYFSHKCRHGRVLFVMESLWGNDGYSFFYKIYELLGDSENHIFDLNKIGNMEYLSTYTRLDGVSVNIMLAKLSDLGIIDNELLKSGLIWSQCFVDDLEDVYSRRKVNKPTKPIQPDKCQQKPVSAGLANTETPQKPANDMKVNEMRIKSKDIAGGSKNGTPPNPGIKLFIDYAFETFEKRFKDKMHIDGQKDGALVKKLLNTYDLDRLKTLWDIFMKSDDPFICQAGRSIGVFKAQINKLISSTGGFNGNGNNGRAGTGQSGTQARAGGSESKYPVDISE